MKEESPSYLKKPRTEGIIARQPGNVGLQRKLFHSKHCMCGNYLQESLSKRKIKLFLKTAELSYIFKKFHDYTNIFGTILSTQYSCIPDKQKFLFQAYQIYITRIGCLVTGTTVIFCKKGLNRPTSI